MRDVAKEEHVQNFAQLKRVVKVAVVKLDGEG